MIPVTIVMSTWFNIKQRVKVAQEALSSWDANLKYDGELRLHVADDGSTLNWKPKWEGPITYSRQERHGVGASLNAGMKEAFKTSPIWAYFVDDWVLQEPLDITPWVQALEENETMGIMRLGPPHPFLRGYVEMVTTNWQGWAMKLDPYGFCVGHRPELFHKRWTDRYGDWEEDINACEVERRATVKWADDPDRLGIYYALPHKFFHYDKSVLPNTSEIEPGMI